MVKLSIIIVSWNVKPLLQRCLRSIFNFVKDIDYEIIVVDNCSQDQTSSFLKESAKKQKNLKVIFNKQNYGFSQANNQALKQAQGEYILFLNPDTEFVQPGFDKLIKKMSQHLNWGIIGCQIKGSDGQIQHSVRNFPTVWSQVLILCKLHYLFFFLPVIKNYFQKNFDFTQQQEVEQVAGVFMLTRAKLLKEIGSFDNNFHLWFEDVDLCYRFKKVKAKIIYYPDFQILHHQGESFGQLFSLRRQKIYNRSLLTYFKKHYPLKKYWPLLIVRHLSLILAQLSEIISMKNKKKIKDKLKIG